MENIDEIEKRPMELQALLKHFKIRYWQIVARCQSKGLMIRENVLSRVLTGLEAPSSELAEELDIIYQNLLERKLSGRQAE